MVWRFPELQSGDCMPRSTCRELASLSAAHARSDTMKISFQRMCFFAELGFILGLFLIFAVSCLSDTRKGNPRNRQYSLSFPTPHSVRALHSNEMMNLDIRGELKVMASPTLPFTLCELDWPIPDVFAIELTDSPGEICRIGKAHKAIAFALFSALIPDHLP